MGLSDFCMNPISNMDGMIPKDIYLISYFYSTCLGENPLDSPLNSLSFFVSDYSSQISSLLTGSCSGNSYLTTSLTELQSINKTISTIGVLDECPPIQENIATVLQSGLCDYSFQGIYVIWIGQYVTTSFVLFVTIVISYMYQFFGEDLLLETIKECKDDGDGDSNDRDNVSFDEENGESTGNEGGSKHGKALALSPNEHYAVTSVMHEGDGNLSSSIPPSTAILERGLSRMESVNSGSSNLSTFEIGEQRNNMYES
jgi:hypothetical protein